VRAWTRRSGARRAGEGARPIATLCWVALLFAITFAALAQVTIPPLTSPVIDLTNTLTAQQVASLDQTLRAFAARKGSQIQVVVVPTTQPETIEQYSIRVAEQWKLGRKGVDDGAILVVAKDDHAVRIEVGYGLEGALTDVLAGRIVDQVILPRFRDGDFVGGINEGVARMIAVIDGEPLPAAPVKSRRQNTPQGIGSALPVLLMLVIVGGGMLRRAFGAFGGASLIGGVAGVIAWFLTSVAGVAFIAAIIAFIFTLMGGGGGGGWSSGRRGGWGGFGGLGGGGFGGGGGGGGGWSGGGGGFGGGGASGRW